MPGQRFIQGGGGDAVGKLHSHWSGPDASVRRMARDCRRLNVMQARFPSTLNDVTRPFGPTPSSFLSLWAPARSDCSEINFAYPGCVLEPRLGERLQLALLDLNELGNAAG